MNCNLILDIGNTICKTAIFENDKCVDILYDNNIIKSLNIFFKKYSVKNKIYSSVKKLPPEVNNLLIESNFLSIKDCIKSPIKSLYKTPKTLGEDRFAAACGAAFLSKKDFPLMVVQMGTCFTFDYINPDGCYTGGAISPGISMRFKSLHNFTSLLPLIEPNTSFKNMGLDTESSIISGVMLGSNAEIRSRINDFRIENKEAPIYVSGGDIKYFDISFENCIFAVPNIVLIGLNYLLNLNT